MTTGERNEKASLTLQANDALARQVCQYLMENLEKHITINQLADRFHISQTQIKTAFRRVYGDSIYSYTRTKKMQLAAQMLEENECSILEIASRCGYTNGSKFAGAFRAEMGVTPREYRAACTKETKTA